MFITLAIIPFLFQSSALSLVWAPVSDMPTSDAGPLQLSSGRRLRASARGCTITPGIPCYFHRVLVSIVALPCLLLLHPSPSLCQLLIDPDGHTGLVDSETKIGNELWRMSPESGRAAESNRSK
jgi:hypothetical protein